MTTRDPPRAERRAHSIDDAPRAKRRVHTPDGTSPAGPYRIATVAELTGVPEPTLRAWERRYGVPTPQRTASGYRLYGPTEVRQVKDLRRLCDEGVAAAEAAKIVLARPTAEPVVRDATEGSHDDLVAAILDTVDRSDDVGLDRELRRLMFIGGAEEILERVISPVLRTVGDRWHRGELTVAQEHFASHKLGSVLRDLVRLRLREDATDRVLLASFADDEHDLGLLGTALRIADWGMRPVFLGSKTPPAAVEQGVAAWRPVLVALSITIPPSRARAQELVAEYGEACGSVPWIVGGAGARSLATIVEGYGGSIAPDAPADLRAMIRAKMSPASSQERRPRR